MKRTLLFATLLVASTAYAADADIDIVPFGWVSEVMRSAKPAAQVKAKTKAPQAAGAQPVQESGPKSNDVAPAKTRAQVSAETREAAVVR